MNGKLKATLLCTTLFTGIALTQAHAAQGIQKATSAVISDNYAETKYPIVFVHGMFGFNRLGSAVLDWITGIKYFQILRAIMQRHLLHKFHRLNQSKCVVSSF